VFGVRLAARSGAQIVGLVRGVLDGLARGVQVTVTGVLDELILSQFKALGFTLAGLDERSRSLVWVALDRLRIRAYGAADGGRLGRRGVLLPALELTFHAAVDTRHGCRQTLPRRLIGT
jgi:hypothetical protein